MKLRKPRLILFDYGETLIHESPFDGLAGTRAVMAHAAVNRHGVTPEQVQAEADVINRELGRADRSKRHLFQVEAPNSMFQNYLYRSMGVEIALSPEEMDRVFWDAAAPGVPTDGIEDFLNFLTGEGIRTAVLSNMSYSGNILRERIGRLLPGNHFERITATSEILFRKPNRRAFGWMLEQAQVLPEDAWYIGDSYTCDVEGALGAGLFPVWYLGARRPQEDLQDDVLTVTRWAELAEMMKDVR